MLVIWKLDRLGRSLKRRIEVVNKLMTRTIGLKSLNDPIDTTTPQGRLIFNLSDKEDAPGGAPDIKNTKSSRAYDFSYETPLVSEPCLSFDVQAQAYRFQGWHTKCAKCRVENLLSSPERLADVKVMPGLQGSQIL